MESTKLSADLQSYASWRKSKRRKGARENLNHEDLQGVDLTHRGNCVLTSRIPGWLSSHLFDKWIAGLLGSSSPANRRLGLTDCVVRCYDSGDVLVEAIQTSDLLLQARALRTVGELKRRDLLPLLHQQLSGGRMTSEGPRISITASSEAARCGS